MHTRCGDIKPDNILIDRRGRVKVADFGLAKLVGMAEGTAPGAPTAGDREPVTLDLTDVGKRMGTPRYMAPEQMERPAEVDHRADIYALGVVFYQMLTGELPERRLQPPSRKVHIDVRLDEVVLHALEKEPQRRYQQMSEVKSAVETIVATPETEGAASGMPKGSDAPPANSGIAWAKPSWPSVFLAGFLGVLLLWFVAIVSFGPNAIHSFVARGALVGLFGGTVTLGLFLLVRRGWFGLCLTGFGLVILLWLGAAMLMTDSLLVGALAEALSVFGLVVFLRKSGLPRRFTKACLTVFFVVFGLTALVTAVLPDAYRSTTRLVFSQEPVSGNPIPGALLVSYDPYRIQTEFELMQSEAVLGNVVKALELRKVWGNRYARGEELKPSEALGLLMGHLALRPVRNSMVIEISAYADAPGEAAEIANAVAKAYLEYRRRPEREGGAPAGFQASIVDTATPGLKPVRPNKPLNLAIGALAGMILGIGVGVARFQREQRSKPSRSPGADAAAVAPVGRA